jgi:hypothetical protein
MSGAGNHLRSNIVILAVTGDGFNGTGPMSSELRDGRIAISAIS